MTNDGERVHHQQCVPVSDRSWRTKRPAPRLRDSRRVPERGRSTVPTRQPNHRMRQGRQFDLSALTVAECLGTHDPGLEAIGAPPEVGLAVVRPLSMAAVVDLGTRSALAWVRHSCLRPVHRANRLHPAGAHPCTCPRRSPRRWSSRPLGRGRAKGQHAWLDTSAATHHNHARATSGVQERAETIP
jgi:hypothetical protein